MKHETWRHDPCAYGSTQPVTARFADVDTRRHVNNIAVYGLHHEPRQRQLYPVVATLASRYGDFDADGGSSEAAVLRGIEQARAALLKAAFVAAGGQAERDWVSLVVARIDLHWMHHRAPPAQWALASAVTHTGRSSAVLRVAMFDGQALQATADCVMVYTDPAGPPGAVALPPALRTALQAFHWLSGDSPCP